MISTKNFVKKAQVSSRVKIGGEIFTITEIIKWKMLRCGQFYHKYSLLDQKGNTDYKFAEDPDSGKFIFVKIFKLDSQNSFAPTIEVEGKKYTFSYGEIWHTERDLFNKSIPEYQEHASIATAVLVYGIANLDHLLSRDGYYIEKKKEPNTKKSKKK